MLITSSVRMGVCQRIATVHEGAAIRITAAFGITCSFGIAEWEPGDAIDRMLRRADVSMYESKKAGRDRITAADTFASTKEHDEWSGAARAEAARA